ERAEHERRLLALRSRRRGGDGVYRMEGNRSCFAHGEQALVQTKGQDAEHAMSSSYRFRSRFGIVRNQPIGMTELELDHTKIREPELHNSRIGELRGDQTRAAFAAQLGVAPHTI